MFVSDAELKVHLDCLSYNKESETPLVRMKHYDKDSIYQVVPESNMIVTIIKGALKLSVGKTLNSVIMENAIFILPIKQNCIIEMIEETTLLFFRLDSDLRFCDHFSLEMLHRENRVNGEKVVILNTNHLIKDYLKQLVKILNDGLHCGYLLKMKLKEFLCFLRYYYPVHDLKAFFSPILSDDLEFSLHIMREYHPALTVGDLAKKMNYSLTGFEKRFKKVFDMPPSKWMQTQRAQAIYHEINCSDKTIAELGYEFGFSSPSHFNNFCRKIFKESLGNIRKRNKKNSQ